jgi:hypothetical protein
MMSTKRTSQKIAEGLLKFVLVVIIVLLAVYIMGLTEGGDRDDFSKDPHGSMRIR